MLLATKHYFILFKFPVQKDEFKWHLAWLILNAFNELPSRITQLKIISNRTINKDGFYFPSPYLHPHALWDLNQFGFYL